MIAALARPTSTNTAKATADASRVRGTTTLSHVHALQEDRDFVDSVLLQVLIVRIQLV